MKLVGFIFMVMLVSAPALAQLNPGNQPGNFVGTCDQYQPGPGGDYCLNTGSATGWFQFKGDVVETYRNTVLCSPTNTTGCGQLTVKGIGGVGFGWIHVIASGATTVLQDCGSGLKCSYSVDMRANTNIVLPCSPDGEVENLQTWQNPAYFTGGGFTPAFRGCGYPTATYNVGEPASFPGPALGSNAVEFYTWVTDLKTRSVPYYLFTSPGTQ